jgi:hypothetical protein
LGQETVAVVFAPIADTLGTSYHETLLYTNASGQQFYSVAFPQYQAAAFVLDVEYAVWTGGKSPYGSIITQANVAFSTASLSDLTNWFGPFDAPYHVQVVDTGDNLSQQWQKISDAYSLIGAESLPYAPISQNSNSVANSALVYAGIPLPTDIGIADSVAAGLDPLTAEPYWSPGSLLPVPPAVTIPSSLYGIDLVTALHVNSEDTVTITNYGASGAPTYEIYGNSGSGGRGPGGAITIFSAAGTPITTAVANPGSGSIYKFMTDGDSDFTLNSSNSVTGFEFYGNGLKALLPQVLHGDPFAVIVNPDGSYQIGLDPTTFDPALDISPNGFNGDTVSISVSGENAVINTQIGPNSSARISNDYPISGLSDTYTFMSNDGTLIIDDPTAFTGTIDVFEFGNTIDLTGISATGATLGNALTINAGNSALVNLNLDPGADYSNESFLIAPDKNGGTEIVGESDIQGAAFTGTNEELLVVDPANSTGTISNFAPGDTIDLVGVSTTGFVSEIRNVLTLQETGGGTVALHIPFDPNPVHQVGPVIIASPSTDGTALTVSNLSYTTLSYGDDSFHGGASSSFANSINNHGEIVGFTNNNNEHIPDDYIYNNGAYSHISASDFASVSVTGPFEIWATGVNDYGAITGYTSATGYTQGFVDYGGAITLLPPYSGYPAAITNSGLVYGNTLYLGDSFSVAGGIITTFGQGFSYSNGAFSPFQYTDRSGTSIPAMFQSASEDGNFVLGYFVDTASVPNTIHHFLEEEGKDVLLPDKLDGFYAFYTAVNDLGDLAGSVALNGPPGYTSYGNFLEKVDGSGIVFSPPGTTVISNPTITSINDSDQMVGTNNYVGVEGSEVSLPSTFTACFVHGTKLRAADDEIQVNEFTVGDMVETHFGNRAEVKWIGYRHVDCARHPDPRRVWPVQVHAGAFGKDLPHRDLWLSPDHAVYVDDVLIPIKHLINGMTIEQVPRDDVTYYHIELDRHDILFAEGLPAESYLDTGDRPKFTNGGVVALHPDFSARLWEANGCAPLIITGPILAAVRARLLQRGHARQPTQTTRPDRPRDLIEPPPVRSRDP